VTGDPSKAVMDEAAALEPERTFIRPIDFEDVIAAIRSPAPQGK
jgi:hypothetical protein